MQRMEQIKWLGTASSVLGSFALSFTFALAGYSLFLVGSSSWLFVAAKNRDKSLFTLNGFFFVANIIGLYNALF